MSTVKLLDGDETSEHYDRHLGAKEKEVCLETSRRSGIVGFFIGLFIQGSSLALNFLLGYAVEDEALSMTSYAITVAIWSLLSGIMGVSVMLLMRGLVVATFYSTNTTTERTLLEEKEKFIAQVIGNLEKYYCIGAIAGVGFAWAFTDLILQIRVHIFQSSIAFFVAFMWYCVSPKKDH
jgi:hypothetical protein